MSQRATFNKSRTLLKCLELTRNKLLNFTEFEQFENIDEFRILEF